LKKVLENVPPLRWGENTQCTFFGALDVALRFLGEPTDYVDLMGFSAAAFRLRFHHPEWCASSTDAAVDERYPKAALEAVGYEGEFAMWLSSKQDATQGMLKMIKMEIDEDRPVLALGLLGSPDWGVVTGYENNKILCRTYYDKGGEYSISKETPLLLFKIKKKGEKPERLERISNSLKFAVEMAYTDEVDGYANGLAAYDVWIRDLEREEIFTKMRRGTFVEHWLINGWVYDNLYDARVAASKYLRRASKEFTGKSQQLVENAAEKFGKIAQKIFENWVYFTMPRSAKRSDFWSLKARFLSDDWTTQMRKNGAKALKTLRSLEEEAFEILKRVVEECYGCLKG